MSAEPTPLTEDVRLHFRNEALRCATTPDTLGIVRGLLYIAKEIENLSEAVGDLQRALEPEIGL